MNNIIICCQGANTQLRASDLDSMAGSTKPIKNFDPLNLASIGSDETLAWFRAAELKHSRVAMLAFVGWVVTKVGRRATTPPPRRIPPCTLPPQRPTTPHTSPHHHHLTTPSPHHLKAGYFLPGNVALDGTSFKSLGAVSFGGSE